MEITQVRPSGYCKGVINAISKVKDAIKKYPDKKIYILGMLIHNKYVVDAFGLNNVITLVDKSKTKIQLIDEIEDGVVVFTAHGIDPKIKQYALDKGLIVLDATCSDVTKNVDLCKEYLSKGFDIFYIGKKNHPESDATICLSDKIHLITDENDIYNLTVTNDKILVTNQTTMSILDIKYLIEKIAEKYPNAVLAEEICNATRTRQNAVRNLTNTDCLIVVGDPSSNNTTQLARIAVSSGIKKVLKIETAKDLENESFEGITSVAITSGASTPSYLTKQVISYLNTFDKQYLQIDLKKVLEL